MHVVGGKYYYKLLQG